LKIQLNIFLPSLPGSSKWVSCALPSFFGSNIYSLFRHSFVTETDFC
jgi:hypothetical protein